MKIPNGMASDTATRPGQMPAPPTKPTYTADEADDEDDYLTMSFEETAPNKNETLTQRKKRLAREAEERGRPRSKAERAAEAEAKRVAALNTSSLDTSSKGFKMMAALGYKAGETLGSGKQEGLREPVGLEMKDDRAGIGANSEKKRKIREEMAKRGADEKRRKVEVGEFRERVAEEREERRKEGLLAGARKVAERLDEEDDDDDKSKGNPDATKKSVRASRDNKKPLRNINILYRGLVLDRAIAEHDRHLRHALHLSLSQRAAEEDDDDDADSDADDALALGQEANTNRPKLAEVDNEEELEQEDAELNEFEALETDEKLRQVVQYLREKYLYCFWCKHRWANADEMQQGCPGELEEDHD